MNALVRTSVYQIKQWMKVRSLILETQWRKRNMALVNKNLFVQRLRGFLVNTSKMLHATPRHCYIRLIIRLLDCVDSWHPRHTGPQVATSAWVNCLLQQADNLGASFLQKVVCFKVDRMSAFQPVRCCSIFSWSLAMEASRSPGAPNSRPPSLPDRVSKLWSQYAELKGRRGMFDYARDGLNPIKPKYSSVLTIVSGLPAAIRTSETAHSADKHFRSVLQVQKKTPKASSF